MVLYHLTPSLAGIKLFASLNYSLKDLIMILSFHKISRCFLGVNKNHAPTPTPLVGPCPAAEVMKRLRFARSPPNELDIASTWREEKPSEVKGFGALPKRIVNVAWFGVFFQIYYVLAFFLKFFTPKIGGVHDPI